jgi:Family of unknown function (DUF6520)
MKKIKWTIMTLVILFSIGAAFATRPANMQSGLYYWNGTGYVPVAGTMGQGWICVSPSSAVCCYTYANGVYTPYMSGSQYTPLVIIDKTDQVVKKRK